MTDYKQLCAELLSTLENEGHAHWPGGPDGDPLIEQARAALAEPEPEGPTDEELRQLYCELFSLQCSPASLGAAPVRFARAVLARWGNYPASPDSSTSPRSENA